MAKVVKRIGLQFTGYDGRIARLNRANLNLENPQGHQFTLKPTRFAASLATSYCIEGGASARASIQSTMTKPAHVFAA